MRLRRSWLVLPILAPLLVAQAAVVYKWVDADGVVHFSDQPEPGAEKVVVTGAPTHGILNGQVPTPAAAQPEKRKLTGLDGMEVSITSPVADQTFSGAEAVTANLEVEPELKPGGPISVSWTLDGAPIAEAEGATHFTLPDVSRGTHTLAATLTDSATGQSKAASPVTFNVLRPSVLSPQHK